MSPRLAALPFLALTFAAVDTLLVRHAHPHRPLEAGLYWQAALLWLAYGAVALVPSALLARWRRQRARGRGGEPPPESAAAAAASVAAWTAGPVLVHARIDRHTDIGGDLSGLLSFEALFDLALALFLLWALVAAARALLARIGPLRAGAGLALGSIAAGLLVSFHDRPEPSADPSAGSGERPNVLLLVWDTTRSRSLSLYGYDRETTPHLAELARDSILFTNARSVSSYTFTSHLSMLTGVYPSHHGARLVRQTFDPHATPTVVEDFARAGYRTGAFVGTGVLRARTGFDWAFETYDDQVDPPVCDTHAWALLHDVQSVLAEVCPYFHNNGLPHWIQDFQRPASDVLTQAAAWIDEPDPRPWFCFVNLYDVHWPYVPEGEARERWVEPYEGPMDGYLKRSDNMRGKEELLRDNPEMLDEGKRHVRQLYDAEMWDLDRHVDAFLAGIDLDRTGVLLTSDHGEAFGEKGQWEHDDILESQVQVPFLVRPAGGVPGGRELDWPVSGIDVGPTLLGLARLEPLASGPRSDAVPVRFLGRNLLEVAESPPPPRSLLVEDRDHLDREDIRIAFYEDRWKLVRLGVGEAIEWKLYDLAADPRGHDDVGAEHPEVVERLRERMDALRAVWSVDDGADAEGGGNANADALRALGYTD